MNQKVTYQKVCSDLEYNKSGLIEQEGQAQTPVQSYLFSEAKRLIGDVDALYFSGDVPIAYFKTLSNFDDEKIRELHRRVWNQSRVPLLFVVTPGELRIYNCFEEPVNPEIKEELDKQKIFIRYFNLAANILEDLKDFSKPQIDSGAFWKSETGQRFHSDRRVDMKLLENLRTTRKRLHDEFELDYSVIHNLLGRSIFILYLEDRGAIKDDYYAQFLPNAKNYFNVIQDKEAIYRLFEKIGKRFNGDLFPVTESEKKAVQPEHLKFIYEFFLGTQMLTLQRVLWRPYDFSVIPIELVSAIYEAFLHKEEGTGYISDNGAYYTPYPLVEFILNEVLPWPSETDHRYDFRILDPACGSGIFLVDAFRRLVARWKFGNNKNKIPHHELKNILASSIYGIDINPDAIKVAAFSLYLALLDYLEPKTIWEDFQFPYLVYQQNNPTMGGKNLFPLDTFSENAPFEKNNYDIVIGNPPWKRDNLPENISNYCRKLGFAQEMAQAFLWRARDFSFSGKIALLATSKILFNNEANDQCFRHELFEKNYVEMIINFSALRRTKGDTGRQLFGSTVGPASVFFYSLNQPEKPKSSILYCTPKPTRVDNALPGITIDALELKFLPREKIRVSDKIWKVAMWGTQRDLEFIENLWNKKSLGDFIKNRKGWFSGVGFQKSGTKYEDEEIANLPLVVTNSIRRYMLSGNGLKKVGNKLFFRLGAKKTYRTPHILIKEGQYNKRFCAAFADFDCAFTKAVFGISADVNETNLLKALTAYLNSSFASYFLFLTASTWGVERERVLLKELYTLPGLPFEMSENSIQELANKVDAIGDLMFDGIAETDERILEVEADIDQIIYDCLDLSENENYLIDDVLQYSLDFFQEGEKSKACDRVDIEDLKEYAKIFCATVNSILQFGEVWAIPTVYDGDVPLRLVSICFDRNRDGANTTVNISNSTSELKNALSHLETQISQKHSQNIYVRRNVKFYYENMLQIVRPDEKRFWTRSMALRDADETLAEVISRRDNTY